MTTRTLHMHTRATKTLGLWHVRWGVAVGGNEDGFWVIVCEKQSEDHKQIVFFFRPSRPASYAESYYNDLSAHWLDEQAKAMPEAREGTLH